MSLEEVMANLLNFSFYRLRYTDLFLDFFNNTSLICKALFIYFQSYVFSYDFFVWIAFLGLTMKDTTQ